MYIKRSIENKFLRLSIFFKAVLVTGARQVGKSTMLKHLALGQNRTYVSLDDYIARGLAKSDPVLFFQTYKPPIIIDEVQYAPELFSQIKIICDSTEVKGLFWLTGSQQYSMMKNLTESLAGRVWLLNLYPFSKNEAENITFGAPLSFDMDSLKKRESMVNPPDKDKIFQSIWRGGMPDLIRANAEERLAYFDMYLNTYLMRDVMEYGNVSDTIRFVKFLYACSGFNAQQLNMNRLANIADVSVKTANDWLNLLQSMNIVYLLQPYFSNAIKRIIKSPKLYFVDTGFCAYLAKFTGFPALSDSAQAGAYFENFAVNEIKKGYDYSQANVGLSYYRDTNGKEIDLLIESNGIYHPLEIKFTARPDKKETKKFDEPAGETFKRASGGIICMCNSCTPIDAIDFYISVSVL